MSKHTLKMNVRSAKNNMKRLFTQLYDFIEEDYGTDVISKACEEIVDLNKYIKIRERVIAELEET